MPYSYNVIDYARERAHKKAVESERDDIEERDITNIMWDWDIYDVIKWNENVWMQWKDAWDKEIENIMWEWKIYDVIKGVETNKVRLTSSEMM